MEVINIDSKAFEELNKKLNWLVNFVLTQEAVLRHFWGTKSNNTIIVK